MKQHQASNKDAGSASVFVNQVVQFVETSTAKVAYRRFGTGPALICIHGWPLHGITFRKLLPYLQEHFTCYLVDTPGAGESRWTDRTDFSFPGQARNFKEMVDKLGLDRYMVLAQDTGASIARHLAEFDSERLTKLAMLNTEIPEHRPPWIPLYRRLMYLPGTNHVFRLLLRFGWFLRMGMGFAGCFVDLSLIEGEFEQYIIDPIRRSHQKILGLNKYLRGIDWKKIDDFKRLHGVLKMPVLLVWGADDTTFPEPLARRMAEQFVNCVGFHSIAGARLLVHEEKPEEVWRSLKPFFLD